MTTGTGQPRQAGLDSLPDRSPWTGERGEDSEEMTMFEKYILANNSRFHENSRLSLKFKIFTKIPDIHENSRFS
jgi:hypothetical protein